MDRNELAALRAKHQSVAEAITACERPDVALQLAFAETDNRKAVIRYASNLVSALEGERVIAGLVTPYPSVREVVDIYADNADNAARVGAHARALFVGTCLAVVIGYLMNRYVWMGMYGNRSIYRWMLVPLVPAFTVIVRILIAWVVRRKAAALDDESAFEMIHHRVTRLADKHPEKMPNVMRYLRRNLVSLFEDSQA